MFCTTECWNCEDIKCENYISKQELFFDNQLLKSVIVEIREYINKNSIYFATSEKVGNYFANCSCDELLQILDKVVDLC